MNRSKILVVDDDPKLSRLVKTILEKTGCYEVQEENRSSAALATARTIEPDMILLDVVLPGLDGFAVCRRLKAESVTRLTPVVLVTGLEIERQQFAALFATEDRTIGMSSFVESGPGKAEFRGR